MFQKEDNEKLYYMLEIQKEFEYLANQHVN
jgi:hypothetical protein